MDLEELLPQAVAARLTEAVGTERAVAVQDLEVDVFGVLEAEVRHVHAVHVFQRRGGGEGRLRRVSLGDATGDVDLVLWGDEVQQAVDGPFLPGARLRLRGATVKAGFRGGVELHLGGAVVEPLPAAARAPVTGRLLAVGPTRIVGDPPAVRFQSDVILAAGDQPINVVLWDEAVRQAREAGIGQVVRIADARPHPLLEGWYVAEGPCLARTARPAAPGPADEGPPAQG